MQLVSAQPTHLTREDWLTAGVEELRPVFDAIGRPIPAKVRVACGFPLNARRSNAIGECHPSVNSGDNAVEILISPVLESPVEVFEVLVHELCHATAGAMNHGINFQKVAFAMGLIAVGHGREPWKSTKGDASFLPTYEPIINGLGHYPHAKLGFNTRKKQSTRMLKAVCPSCGYTIRLTTKWASQGLPDCVCGDTFAL